MLATPCQSKSGILFGLLLTRIFDFFKIDFKNATKNTVKEVFDAKYLAMSNLQVENGELVRILPNPPPESPSVPEPSSTASSTSLVRLIHSLLDDNSMVLGKPVDMATDVNELKNEVLGVHNQLKGLKVEFRLSFNISRLYWLSSHGVKAPMHTRMLTHR